MCPEPSSHPHLPEGPIRHKLGLALAGGGFRASLFHLGVLRRLAELDLLRYVEVLSTVSGGSVVGALYLMHLKAELEQPMLAQLLPRQAGLNHEQYKHVVLRVEQDMRRAAQRNLRTRLLMNPFKLASVLLGPSSLATAMAKVYERELLAEAVKRVRATGYQDPLLPEVQQAWRRLWKQAQSRFWHRWHLLRAALMHAMGQTPSAWDGGISLRALRLRAPASSDAGGSENYNHEALWAPSPSLAPGSALTRWIINATSLNSGARFWFSHAELGEWYFGHLRYEEIESQLLARKALLYPDDPALPPLRLPPRERAWALAVLALWQSSASTGPLAQLCPALLWCWAGEAPVPVPTAASNAEPAWASRQLQALVQALTDAEAGRLRVLKTAAWFLSVGWTRQPRVADGLSRAQHLERLWEALAGVAPEQAVALRQALSTQREFRRRPLQEPGLAQLCRLILEVYNLRGAWMVSPRAAAEWDALPLAQAVTASAAFPPVFPPYLLSDFYDDRRIRTLGLTDGGVFDNLGTTALIDEQCNLIIASDPGGLFDNEELEASVGRLGLSARLTAILSELPLNLFRHELRERQRLTEQIDASSQLPAGAREFLNLRALHVLVTFRIDSGVPLLRGRQMLEETDPAARRAGAEAPLCRRDRVDLADQRERRLLARLRTDLDAFSDLEAEALIRQGYLQAEHNLLPLRAANSPLAAHPGWAEKAQPPYEPPVDDAAAMRRRERHLRAGSQRFLRLLALWGPVWQGVFLLLLPLAALLLLFGPAEFVGAALPQTLLPALQRMLSEAQPGWWRVLVPVGWAGLPLSLGVLVYLLVQGRSAVRARAREFGLPPPRPWPLQIWWRRRMPTRLRELRYYRGWLIYAGGFLFLPGNWLLAWLAAPLLLVLTVSTLALLGHTLLTRPLLWLARRGTGLRTQAEADRVSF